MPLGRLVCWRRMIVLGSSSLRLVARGCAVSVLTPVGAVFFCMTIAILMTMKHRYLVVILVAGTALAGQVAFNVVPTNTTG